MFIFFFPFWVNAWRHPKSESDTLPIPSGVYRFHYGAQCWRIASRNTPSSFLDLVLHVCISKK